MFYKICFWVLDQSLSEKKFYKSTKNPEKHAIDIFTDYLQHAHNVDVDINDYIKSLDVDDIDLLSQTFLQLYVTQMARISKKLRSRQLDMTLTDISKPIATST